MNSNLTDNIAKLKQQAVAAKDGLTTANDLAARARRMFQEYYAETQLAAQ